MAGKKPQIAIGEDFSIYVGNSTDSELVLEAGELFGFGRGIFEQREVRHSFDRFQYTFYEFFAPFPMQFPTMRQSLWSW